ncbi:extracellular solute-binding protein [Pseudactinotalea sp.]|uniref:extracellular solute-binding protein n=1 Tax=Pseudactinotalea sp. TaxID=1926260 RepID=UPI003B3B5AC0
MTMTNLKLSRRSLLGGFGVAGLVGASSLAACSQGGSGGPEPTNPSTGIALPSYIRFEGGEPDIAGTEAGIPDVYFSYPANPQAVSSEVPSDGSPITVSVPSVSPVPPTMDRNAFWQGLNERLGTDLTVSITPAADWSDRFATAVAGDNLGDLFNVDGSFARLPQFLETQCQDLTEYLAGDAIADYPFLANIPTDSWRGCVFNGGIYGIPVPRGVLSTLVAYTRNDLFAARGVDPGWTSMDELLQTSQEMTDERSNTWALAAVPLQILQQMVGLPNTWQLEGGAFTHIVELEEYKEALEFGRRLLEAGVVHPDSVGSADSDRKTWFDQGSAAVLQGTYSAMGQLYRESAAGPGFDVGIVTTPGPDGDPAQVWLGNPNNSISAMRRAEPERVRMLLSVLNWLAAPFGTEEHLFRKFGEQGVHHERGGSDPVLNDRGISETALGLQYLVEGPLPLHYPDLPEVAQRVHDHMTAAVPDGMLDPTLGLYSAKQSELGSQLNTIITDASNSVLLGREPISSWDDVLQNWRTRGGDEVAAEYEAALEARDG